MAEYIQGKIGFDCLITDVSLPGHSGLDLLRRLRGLGSEMPVIVMTADTNPATRSHALCGGAHAYLTKPIDTEALARHLRSSLRRAGTFSRD
jgi:DNA-binding response OmpR family regulator